MAEYIEREALIKRFEVTPILMYGIPAQVRDGVLDLVEKQPAADVAPVVHGRWIPFEHWVHKTFWKGKACSVCNANIGHKTVFKFCPNCGAKMRGAE